MGKMMNKALIKELGISEEVARLAVAKYNDLKAQADMFGMDIDIETWSLVPKIPVTYTWLDRWLDKRAEGDFDELMDIDRE